MIVLFEIINGQVCPFRGMTIWIQDYIYQELENYYKKKLSMKTGLCPLAIDKHHAFVKASFPICMALPNSAHSRMGCLHRKRKSPPIS